MAWRNLFEKRVDIYESFIAENKRCPTTKELAEAWGSKIEAVYVYKNTHKDDFDFLTFASICDKEAFSGVDNKTTLRDQLAGQALAGLLAAGSDPIERKWLAEQSYTLADSMLEFRK